MNTSYKCMAILFSSLFVFNSIILDLAAVNRAYAADFTLPAPNSLCEISANYSMPELVGLAIGDSAYDLSLLFDSNDAQIVDQDTVEETMNYFLAALSMPAEKMWVNLSPYEQDRIIDQDLAKTDLGRGFLDQDYILKLFSATLTNPETDLGKDYWQANGLVDNLSKVWITPKSAAVYEQATKVLITKSELAAEARAETEDSQVDSKLLAVIEKELNQGENFAKMRQIYNAVILARWFKNKIKNSVLSSYANSAVVKGIDSQSADYQEQVWQQYCQSFEEGVYNKVIKETKNNKKQKRQYIAGGVIMPEFEISSSLTVNDFKQNGVLYESHIAMTSSSLEISTSDIKKKEKFIAEVLSQRVAIKSDNPADYAFLVPMTKEGRVNLRINGSVYSPNPFSRNADLIAYLKKLNKEEILVRFNVVYGENGLFEKLDFEYLNYEHVPQELKKKFSPGTYVLGEWDVKNKRRKLVFKSLGSSFENDKKNKKKVIEKYLLAENIEAIDKSDVIRFKASLSPTGIVNFDKLTSVKLYGNSESVKEVLSRFPKNNSLVDCVVSFSNKDSLFKFSFDFNQKEALNESEKELFGVREYYLGSWEKIYNKRNLIPYEKGINYQNNKFFLDNFISEILKKQKKSEGAAIENYSFDTSINSNGYIKRGDLFYAPFGSSQKVNDILSKFNSSEDLVKHKVMFDEKGDFEKLIVQFLAMNSLNDEEKKLFIQREFVLGEWNQENGIYKLVPNVSSVEELLNPKKYFVDNVLHVKEYDFDKSHGDFKFTANITRQGIIYLGDIRIAPFGQSKEIAEALKNVKELKDTVQFQIFYDQNGDIDFIRLEFRKDMLLNEDDKLLFNTKKLKLGTWQSDKNYRSLEEFNNEVDLQKNKARKQQFIQKVIFSKSLSQENNISMESFITPISQDGIVYFFFDKKKESICPFGNGRAIIDVLKKFKGVKNNIEIKVNYNEKAIAKSVTVSLVSFDSLSDKEKMMFKPVNYMISSWDPKAGKRSLNKELSYSELQKENKNDFVQNYLKTERVKFDSFESAEFTSLIKTNGIVSFGKNYPFYPFGLGNEVKRIINGFNFDEELFKFSVKLNDAEDNIELKVEFLKYESLSESDKIYFKPKFFELGEWVDSNEARDLIEIGSQYKVDNQKKATKFKNDILTSKNIESSNLNKNYSFNYSIYSNGAVAFRINGYNYKIYPFTTAKVVKEALKKIKNRSELIVIHVNYDSDGVFSNVHVEFADQSLLNEEEKKFFAMAEYKLGSWDSEGQFNNLVKVEDNVNDLNKQKLIDDVLAQKNLIDLKDAADYEFTSAMGISDSSVNLRVNGNNYSFQPFGNSKHNRTILSKLSREDHLTKFKISYDDSGTLSKVAVEFLKKDSLSSEGKKFFLDQEFVVGPWIENKKRREFVNVRKLLLEKEKLLNEPKSPKQVKDLFEQSGVLELVDELSYYPDELAMLLSIFTDYSDEEIVDNLSIYSQLSLHEYQGKNDETQLNKKDALSTLLNALDKFDSKLADASEIQQNDILNVAFKVALRSLIKYDDLEQINKLFRKLKTKKKKVKDFFAQLENKVKEALREIEAINPEHITTPLRPHQKYGVYMAAKYPEFANFNEARTGKTLEALASLDPNKKNLLVVPNHLIDTWKSEITEFTTLGNVSVLNGEINAAAKNKVLDKIASTTEGQTVIVSVESYLRDPSYDISIVENNLETVIFDEAQFFSNYFGEDSGDNSIQAQNAQKIKANKKLILSATPFHSKPEQLYALYTLLFPEEPLTNAKFNKRYINGSTKSLVDLYMKLGQKSTRTIKKDVFNVFDESMTLEQKQKSIPSVNTENIDVAMTYEQSLEMLSLLMDKEADDKDGPLSYWEIKQRAENLWWPVIETEDGFVADESSPAWQALDDYVASKLDSGKGIVYAYNLDQMEAMKARFEADYGKGAVAMMNGNTAKIKELNKFKTNDECKILIMSVQSGVGIDVSQASWMVYAQLPKYFSQYYQSKERPIGANPFFVRPSVDMAFIIPSYVDLLKELYAENKKASEYLDAGSPYEMDLLRLQMEELQYMKTIGGAQVNPTINRLVKNTAKFKQAHASKASSSSLVNGGVEMGEFAIDGLGASTDIDSAFEGININELGAFSFEIRSIEVEESAQAWLNNL